MAEEVSPLNWQTPIVNPETGRPTNFFIRQWQESLDRYDTFERDIEGVKQEAEAGPKAGIRLELSRHVATIYSFADGSGTDFSPASGSASLFDGVNNITHLALLSIKTEGLSATIDPLGNFAVTGISGDTGRLTVQASYNGNVYSDTMNVRRFKTGYEIIDTLPSTNLFEGRIVFDKSTGRLMVVVNGQWSDKVKADQLSLIGFGGGNLIPDGGIASWDSSTDATYWQPYNNKNGITPSPTDLATISQKIDAYSDKSYDVFSASIVHKVSGSTSADPTDRYDTLGIRSKAEFWSNLQRGVDYVVSFDALVTTSSNFISGFKVCFGGVQPDVNVPINNPSPSSTFFKRYSFRIRFDSSPPSSNPLFISAVGSWTPGDLTQIIFDNIQVEKGVVPSAFAPRPDDILPGTIAAPMISNEAVTAAKIAAGAITEVKIDTEAVTAAKIAAGAITEVKIDNAAVTGTKIADDAVTTPKLAANAVEANKIAANAITSSKILAGAIQTGHIAAGAIEAGNIAAGAIATGHIAAGTVTTPLLAANAVIADKIASNAVTTNKIDTGAITAAKIGANEVNTIHLASKSVTTNQVNFDGVTLSGDGNGNLIIKSSGVRTTELSYGATGVETVLNLDSAANFQLGSSFGDVYISSQLCEVSITNTDTQPSRVTLTLFWRAVEYNKRTYDIRLVYGSPPVSVGSGYLSLEGSDDIISVHSWEWEDTLPASTTRSYRLQGRYVNSSGTEIIGIRFHAKMDYRR